MVHSLEDTPLALLRLARSEAEAELRKSLAKASMLALTLCVAVLALRAAFGGPTILTRELPGFPIDPTIFERYVPAAPMGDVVPIQPTVRTDGVIKPVDELDVDRTKDAVVPTGETIVPGVGDPNAKAGPVTGTGSGTGVVDTVEPKPDDFIFTEELPQAVLKVVPEYPAIARQAGMEGEVLVRMLVGTDGRVLRAEVQKGSALFDEEALKAARQWTFTPALTDGKPVMVWVRVPFNFRLH